MCVAARKASKGTETFVEVNMPIVICVQHIDSIHYLTPSFLAFG